MKAKFLFAVSVSVMLAAGALSASAANRPNTKPMPRMEKDFKSAPAPAPGRPEAMRPGTPYRYHAGHRHMDCRKCKCCGHCAKHHSRRHCHAVPPPPPQRPGRAALRHR